jgi:putative aldouronate transport system permease protein
VFELQAKRKVPLLHQNGFRLFLMILPLLLVVFLFSYVPLYGWIYAFFNYKPGKRLFSCEFVGWKWFTLLVSDVYYRQDMLRVMRNTLAMSFMGILSSWLPMFFAIFLSEIRSKRYKKLVQTASTIPNFISWVLVYAVAYSMFSVGDGFINRLLIRMGLVEDGINFLASGDHIWIKMWLWSVWKGLGWSAVTYIAALSGVDQELYDAADVDGAGRFGKMWHISLPGLVPTFFVLLILSIGNLINNGMDQYFVFENPMNHKTIEVLDLYVYNQGLAGRMYSFSVAVGMMKSVISLCLITFANRLSKLVRGNTVF